MGGPSPLLGAVFSITDVVGTRSVTQLSLAGSQWEAQYLGDALRKPKTRGQVLINYMLFQSLIGADFIKFQSIELNLMFCLRFSK